MRSPLRVSCAANVADASASGSSSRGASKRRADTWTESRSSGTMPSSACERSSRSERRGKEARPLAASTAAAVAAGLGIHPEDFPMVAVEVVEAPAVHEAVVLRIHGVLSAGGDGLVHYSVHLRPAAAREREERLRVLRRIAELPPRERLEEGLIEQHDVGFFADDHASGLVVGELRVEPEAELRSEPAGRATKARPRGVACYLSVETQ